MKFLLTVILLLLDFLYTNALTPSPPKITKQPFTNEIYGFENEPLILKCEAEGEPAPRYHWKKNNKNFYWDSNDDRMLQIPGKGTLFIANFKNIDVGEYQCFAENELGVATANPFFVNNVILKSFRSEPPLSVVGSEGEPFKLSCIAPYGNPKPEFSWIIQYTNGPLKSINNSRMTTDPEGDLWFSYLTREDQSKNFMYTCVTSSPLTNEYKLRNKYLLDVTASNTSLLLNTQEPVLQYSSHGNITVLLRESVELFCIFGGTPVPEILWNKNGIPIKYSKRITQGNYGKSLIIEKIDFSDEAFYSCKANNGVGESKSQFFNLSVVAKPYFTEEPKFVTAAEKESAQFTCTADGVPKPEIKWIHNGKPIEEAPSNVRRKIDTNSIVIENLTLQDTGNYGCNATNSLGYIYKDVYVNVLPPYEPTLIEPLQDREVVSGQSVTLSCKVFGIPQPKVEWFRNVKEFIGSTNDLLITNAVFSDAGVYECRAQNEMGLVSANLTLTVKKPPRITFEPVAHETAAMSSATLPCKRQSDPSLPVEIIWLRDGVMIDFDNEPRFIKTTDGSLTISKTVELDAGTYTCVAKTPLDEDQNSVTLIVQDIPNPPAIRGTDCNWKDVVLHWLPMGDNRAPIKKYIIEYNTSVNPDKWETIADNIPPEKMNFSISMSAAGHYSFRITASNKIGNSSPSDHSTICTVGNPSDL